MALLRRVDALIPFVLGVLWVAYAVASFPLGGLHEPGPALWPVIVGVLLVAMSVILFVTEDTEDHEPFTARSRFVALGALSTAVFIVLFEQVGFVVAGFLLLLFWARYLGRESWRLSVAVAAGVTLAFYYVFGPLLNVPLPGGLLG